MNTEIEIKEEHPAELSDAVSVIKTAILQSQARAAQGVNQEQLALYYGIGRFISNGSRRRNWGAAVIDGISKRLKVEMPGLRGFGSSNLKNMRAFYEAWNMLEPNSPIQIGELSKGAGTHGLSAKTGGLETDGGNSAIQIAEIRQLELTNLPNFPLAEFLSIGFTHHIRIIESTKTLDERLFYIRYCHAYKTHADDLPGIIKQQRPFEHQDKLPNNFVQTLPDYKQAFRAMQMFKDEYLLDFINVEELGMRDEEIDERVIEQSIVQNVKKFIMTFGRGFSFIGNQVHFDKLGHDHWIDLLFYNRDLRRTVVFELKKGKFKTAYLAQLSSYLRILNDEDRREGEESPIGVILCKSVDRPYVEYIMQDFRQPMGVATYRTAGEIDPDLLKALPPKEELERLLEPEGRMEADA